MKTANSHLAPSIPHLRALVLLSALAGLTLAVACSRNSRPAASSPPSAGARLRPAAMEASRPAVNQARPGANLSAGVKPPPSKLLAYRSRNYGVSFLYPWQYAFISARTIVSGDPSLRPMPDGHDGQFSLARIEIPRGFYSDSDYESGYFILSLNQDVNEQQCESILQAGNDAKLEIETINGVGFRRVETESGGRGRAVATRHYVTFTNGTCYELEMGVKTSNQNGLAREVDPHQVLRRLEAILQTVKIVPALEDAAGTEPGKPAAAPAPVSQD